MGKTTNELVAMINDGQLKSNRTQSNTKNIQNVKYTRSFEGIRSLCERANVFFVQRAAYKKKPLIRSCVCNNAFRMHVPPASHTLAFDIYLQ